MAASLKSNRFVDHDVFTRFSEESRITNSDHGTRFLTGVALSSTRVVLYAKLE